MNHLVYTSFFKHASAIRPRDALAASVGVLGTVGGIRGYQNMVMAEKIRAQERRAKKAARLSGGGGAY